MRGLKHIQPPRTIFFLPIIFTIVLVAVIFTNHLLASTKKYQIELYGGFSSLNPADLNLLVQAEVNNESFFYQDYYRNLEANGDIYWWEHNTTGQLKKIKHANLFGGRLKLYIKPTLAISLGFKSVSRTESPYYMFEYIRDDYNDGTLWVDRKEYSPTTITSSGLIPSIGIHLHKKLSDFFEVEGYISAGPLFAKCNYDSNWNTEWVYRVLNQNQNHTMYSESGSFQMNGKGVGIALDGGVRINLNFSRRLGFFLESGYAYQVAPKISGDSFEYLDNRGNFWEGEWGIIKMNTITPWGQMEYEIPNNLCYQMEFIKTRNFRLNLSGFQFRVGIFFRL